MTEAKETPPQMAVTAEQCEHGVRYPHPWPIESRGFDWRFARKGIRGGEGL